MLSLICHNPLRSYVNTKEIRRLGIIAWFYFKCNYMNVIFQIVFEKNLLSGKNFATFLS